MLQQPEIAVVLLFRRPGERQLKAGVLRQVQRNPAVLCRVSGGEEAGVIAVLHVFAVGLQDA